MVTFAWRRPFPSRAPLSASQGGTLADWLHPGGPPAAGTTSGGLLQPSRPLIDRLRMALQVGDRHGPANGSARGKSL